MDLLFDPDVVYIDPTCGLEEHMFRQTNHLFIFVCLQVCSFCSGSDVCSDKSVIAYLRKRRDMLHGEIVHIEQTRFCGDALSIRWRREGVYQDLLSPRGNLLSPPPVLRPDSSPGDRMDARVSMTAHSTVLHSYTACIYSF